MKKEKQQRTSTTTTIEEKKSLSKYNNISIAKIMRGSFLCVIFLTVVMMVLAMLSLSHVATRTKSLYEGPFFKSTMVMEIKECIAQIERDFYHSLLSDDSQEVETLLQSIEESNQTVEKNLSIIDGLATGQEQGLVEECYNLLNHAVSILESIKNSISAGHSEEAYRLIQEDYMPLLSQAEELMGQMADLASDDAEGFVTSASNYANSSILFNILFLLVVFCFCLWVAGKVTAIIVRPVQQVAHTMEQMADGILRIELPYIGKNELGVMSESIRTMAVTLQEYVHTASQLLQEVAAKNMNLFVPENFRGDFKPISNSLQEILDFLNQMVGTARIAAENVNTGAGQVAGLSGALADTSAEQASAVTQLAASVNEVTCNVEENAKNAGHANEISLEAVQKIEDGNKRMKSLLASMQDIEQQSREISGIMNIIDSIARQTNLLSLNASIEAARAGDAGRGFAVVAQEIGTLAQECANAAKNTASLIQSNIDVTQKGAMLAEETAGMLADVVRSVEDTGRLVANITGACSQQAAALQDISSGVETISDSVERLSGMSQEASAASQELLSQSETLDEMLEQYQLRNAPV